MVLVSVPLAAMLAVLAQPLASVFLARGGVPATAPPCSPPCWRSRRWRCRPTRCSAPCWPRSSRRLETRTPFRNVLLGVAVNLACSPLPGAAVRATTAVGRRRHRRQYVVANWAQVSTRRTGCAARPACCRCPARGLRRSCWPAAAAALLVAAALVAGRPPGGGLWAPRCSGWLVRSLSPAPLGLVALGAGSARLQTGAAPLPPPPPPPARAPARPRPPRPSPQSAATSASGAEVRLKVLHVNKFLYRRGGAEALHGGRRPRCSARPATRSRFFGMAHPDNTHLELRRPLPAAGRDGPARRRRCPSKARASARMLWSTVAAAAGWTQVVDEFRPDVVHLHNIYHQLSPSVLRPLRRRGLPAVMTLHDYKLACPTYLFLDKGKLCEACLGGHFRQAVRRRCKDGSLAASALPRRRARRCTPARRVRPGRRSSCARAGSCAAR